MTAIKRKFLMPALVSALTVAGAASCATGGADHVAAGTAEKEAPAAAKQATAPSTEAAPADPFAGLTAARIAGEAVTATKGAPSLRLTAEGTDDGRRVKVDFSLDRSGTCTGGLRRDDSEAEFAVVKGVTYVKGDDEFWRSISSGANDVTAANDANDENDESGRIDQSADTAVADELVQLLKGKWLKIPAGAGASARALGGACDLDAMLDGVHVADAKGATRGAAAEVEGRKAATLVKRETDGTRTTYVAAEGEPYLLKAVSEGGRAPGTVLLTDFGVPVKVAVPLAAETVDLRDVRQSASRTSGL
ncbi:hypothetical protein OG275_25550 [Streptomyces niveus]|uniref:hypothetical protein n=1 Tax=Streptomyces niveus TaxID=193462 RepID=UPI002E33A7B3|nr:hypothetical protein [Streptomyces niveus]